ncbi:hypothetical protein HY483_02295 [Candidatus Woesearchaeota archaeon]|nr:hypothetical protein [Candidatus Woesearchaeota archaeon]
MNGGGSDTLEWVYSMGFGNEAGEGNISEAAKALDRMSSGEVGRRIRANLWHGSSETGRIEWYNSTKGVTPIISTTSLEVSLGTIQYVPESAIRYKDMPIQKESFGNACGTLLRTLRIIEGNNPYLRLVQTIDSCLIAYMRRHNGCFDTKEFCSIRERIREQFSVLDTINPFEPQRSPNGEELYEMIQHFMTHGTFDHPAFEEKRIEQIRKNIREYFFKTKETGTDILLWGVEPFQHFETALDEEQTLWIPVSTLSFAYITGDVECEEFKDLLKTFTIT